MGKLDGKVALITGGARGQGRSHAVALAGEGASIVICDIAGEDLNTIPYPLGTQEQMHETVKLVEDLDQRCIAVKANVADTAQMNSVVDAALSEFGQIDILLANAGIFTFGSIAELTDEQWDEMIATNLTGVFKSIRAVLPHMIERGTGNIVATSSVAGKQGFPNTGHYSSAKWGVIGLIKSVAMEVGAHGIRANAICPTSVDTQMIRNDAFSKLFSPGEENPTLEMAEEILSAMNPQGIPYITVQDVSDTVLYLVGDQSKHVTGETITIASGWNASNAA